MNINSESLFIIGPIAMLSYVKRLHLANYDKTISPLEIRNKNSINDCSVRPWRYNAID